MPEMDDITLLREYAETGSHAAFAALVCKNPDAKASLRLKLIRTSA
jgi:hypothetical protein